jgi:putative nucleotidyltransferase with HDIG domain
MVATLSEAAAKAIGADPLLCRVGGLYHDIGKLRRPHCFVENQSGDNIHDRLSPGLSALLIKAHVKDGLELGRAIRLPQPVLEIIQQHHGTSVIMYFYHRARQMAEETGVPIPDEKNFRYVGPRPRSKEAAILMLADSIEASARALPQVTPESLAVHIRTIVQGRLSDGELDEAELTLHDIGVIQEAFTVVLRGVLHHRIEYPDPAELNRDGEDWVRETLRTDTLTPEGLVEGPEHGPKMNPARPARRSREREVDEESGASLDATDAEVAEKRQNSKDKDGKSRERRRGRKAGANNPEAGRNGRAPREEKPASDGEDADGASRRRLTSGFKTGFPAFHVQRHDGPTRIRNGHTSKSPADGGETAPSGQHSAPESAPDGALEPPGTPIPGHPLPPTGVGPAAEGRPDGSLAGKHPQPGHAFRGQNGAANSAAALPRTEETPEPHSG